MKKIFVLFFVAAFSLQISRAQETFFQTGHTHDILAVHFSPDDSRLVSYSAGDGKFILWDVKSGRQIWTRETGFIRRAYESANLEEFYWSRDGAALVTKSANGTYQTWDARTGKIIALTETKPAIELLAPDKKQISYTKDYSSVTFTGDGQTRQFKRFGNNSAFDTSNNGEMFAEGAGWGDASIKITEIKTGKSWFLDGHPSVVGGIAFSPDGKFLAVSGSDKFVYVFDVAAKSVVKKLDAKGKPLKSISFSPNGEYLFVLNEGGEISVWHLPDEKLLRGANALRGIFRTVSNEFSRDGKYFLFVNEGDFGVWRTADLKQMSGFKTAEKYESKSGEMTFGYDRVPVYAATFINDGKEILASHYDGTWRVWNVASGRQTKKFNVNEDAKFLVNLGNQKVIAVVHGRDENYDEMKIKIFNSASGAEVKKFDDEDTGFIEAITLSPNGKDFVTSDIGGDVYLWNINESKPVREFDIGFSGDDSIAFSPDGKTFAVGGENQNLFLFDTETGAKLWQLIPSYQPGELEIQLEERGKKGRAEVDARNAGREKQAETYVGENKNKITAKFSHYGTAESFWDQKIAETGVPDKSKIKLPKEKATVAWFALTNDADLPIAIDTNSMIFNPKCKGLCDGAEISSRYVMELKNGDARANGIDMYSTAVLPPGTTVYFSVALEDFKRSKQIYLGFTFQKDNPDDAREREYGTEQKLYLKESDLPE